MPLIYEDRARKNALYEVAQRMMTAARTAPKGHGTDNLIIAVAERDVIETIAAKMKDMVQTGEAAAFFDRDANNILQSEIMVLLATKIKPLGLKNCGLCGFIDCREKEEHRSIRARSIRAISASPSARRSALRWTRGRTTGSCSPSEKPSKRSICSATRRRSSTAFR